MPAFAEHLDYLTSSSREAGSNEIKPSWFDDWTSYRASSGDASPIGSGENTPWVSVLDMFCAPQNTEWQHPVTRSILRQANNVPVNIVLTYPISKLDRDRVLELSKLLASSHTSEAISTEVAEIVGLNDIELAGALVQSRMLISQQLAEHLHSQHKPGVEVKPKESCSISLASEDARLRVEDTLRANAARPLFTVTAGDRQETLPHVYTSSSSTGGGSILSQFGTKYALPVGTARHDYEDYLEVVIPPAKPVPPRYSERIISIHELDELGYSQLNRVQSIVYRTAYQSNANMLVCDQHRRHIGPGSPVASIDRDSFKIIYVAPMKALASEITHKLGKRLGWLGIKVRELTGDMQLTKTEIAETQIIVTTPEKWDVVTRKPAGEGELGSRLKLLIIDEIHLLNEDRGAVIETIVARTLRQAEFSQSVIRIVGLSATLPNYVDVADFLSVSRHTGLFYFDSSFRPIPLEQHFIGIRGKPGSVQSKRNLDRVTFEKVSELVKQGHQVMVFVHARRETVNTAFTLKEAAQAEGVLADFSCEDNAHWNIYRRSIGESRNKEMKQLFDYGFGIHHAGMLRSDRNLMEALFRARAIKVLCCTATLAWGVNLPAHAVIIKGTQVYDSAKGAFVDLSVLDVLQVFGRAGRPGLETSGEGYICTTEDKLTHYLEAVTSQNAIESKFLSGMVDALNAEISLGTVTNVRDAIRWLSYTYLFVRMQRNPFQYGMKRELVADTAAFVERQRELVRSAAKELAKLKMIEFSFQDDAEAFTIKDVGRIAAKYYIRYQSIAAWQNYFKPSMSEADVLRMLSFSTEFNQIQVRESELKELENLMKNIPCEVYIRVKGKSMCYCKPIYLDIRYKILPWSPTLPISRKWAGATTVLAGMSKAVEKRMWPYDEPMKQFPLKRDIIYGLGNSSGECHPYELASMTAAELGETLPSVTVRLLSDKWLGADNERFVPLSTLFMPASPNPHTRRLDVGFLPLSSFRLPALEKLYSDQSDSLNAIQTQIFWSIVNTMVNVLVAAPVGSGKSSLVHMAIWSTLLRSRMSVWALIVTPTSTVAISTLSELRSRSPTVDVRVEYAKENISFSLPRGKVIRVVTAAVLLDAIWGKRLKLESYPHLVVCEALEQLDDTYELAVSLLRRATQHSSTRYIGLSRSLNDPTDLASWLGVKPANLHSFLPGDREQPLTCSVQTYTIPLSDALFKTLAKPAYAAMGLGAYMTSAIIVVPSRGHCQTVAQELITQHSLNSLTETGFLPQSASAISVESRLAAELQDFTLVNFASRGVGIIHKGIPKAARQLILDLFVEGSIRVLIVSREACRSLPVKASAVIVLGTQYVQIRHSSERHLKDYTLQEVVEMQSRAVQQSEPGHFSLFCPIEDGEMFNKFLNEDGLPLESQLLETELLRKWYKEQMAEGAVRNKQDAVVALSFTFLARRVVSNPAYYDLEHGHLDEVLSRIADRLDHS
ncbi:hypothetical protein ID866_7939 [Astraeus odoratus]|nr:hypothetical protein ID866_7939 [Astraeus odoratus]